MKYLSVISLAASSLLAAQVAVADNVAPVPIYADITPAYRTGDMHNYSGEVIVRVTNITGQHRSGKQVVLFRDNYGALLPMVELKNLAMLINPMVIADEGEYTNLTVTLADKAFSFNRSRVTISPLPSKLAAKVLNVRGSVDVGKYEVTTSGLEL